MPNITITLDEKLLKKGREYAKNHQTSLNAIIRKLLTGAVHNSSEDWLDECFKLMDKTKANSHGNKWKRKDLYDV